MDTRRFFISLGVAAWAAALLTGFRWISDFKTTPGEMAHWPEASALVASSDRHTLILFVRPTWQAAQASVTELRELMLTVRDLAHAIVVVVSRTPDPELVAEVLSIPSTTLAVDVEGDEARAFAANTTGHVLIYDRKNALVFNGDLAGARAHAVAAVRGESAGARR